MDRGRAQRFGKTSPVGRLARDLATRASRAELALAFVAAALAGGLLSVMQAVLQGHVPPAVLVFGAGLFGSLALTLTIWVTARRVSLDLGLCVVIRRGQLRNREQVTKRLSRSTRDWVPFEFVDDSPGRWAVPGLPEGVETMVRNIGNALTTSVGEPRALLCVSASDAIGFYLGHSLRPSLLGTEIHLLTLPTASQDWKPMRYTVGAKTHRKFFVGHDLLNGACSCERKRGTGILDAARSPRHNAEIVLASLVEQGLICCRNALYQLPSRSSGLPVSQASALEAASFVRARARLLSHLPHGPCVDLVLTCGAEVGVHTGLVLSGFCRWRVWEFDTGSERWEARWESA